MISKKMEKLLNAQFLRELYAANQYLAISSYFEEQELDGFAHYFRVQAQEELAHAMKQFDYLHQVDGRIVMEEIPKPTTEFSSTLEAIEHSLSQEREVTKNINGLLKSAVEENDFATQAFLQWFVTEQVEEEANLHNLIRKLKLAGDNTSALFMLNDQLGGRRAESSSFQVKNA